MELRKQCDECGIEFVLNSNRQKRCSKICQDKAHFKLKKNWQDKNKDRVDLCRNTWKTENNKQEVTNLKNSYLSNKEDRLKYQASWQKENKDKCNANQSKYRAIKLSASIEGFDNEILEIYKMAKELQLQDGVNREVHHIVPLQQYSEIICGLHVPWNLEVLTEQEHRQAHEELKEVYGRTSSGNT